MKYYALKNGEYTEVSKDECLAENETYGTISDFRQRWYIEAGICVRLPRSQEGENIFLTHMRDKQREEKYQQRKIQCVWKNTKNCDQNCVCCNRRNTSRTVELDMNFRQGNENNKALFEPVDDFDIASFLEDKALLDTLYSALAALTSEEQSLIKDIFWQGKSERQIAPELGLKEPKSVNKRKHRILEILRQNEDLKNFFK